MPRVFLGNFDFEHELAAGRNWQPAAALQRINAELACSWLAEANADDLIVTPLPIDPQFARDWATQTGVLPRFQTEVTDGCRGWTLVPWGWSAQAADWGRTRGLVCDHPPLEVARSVNDRLFSHGLEVEWNLGLAGSAVIQSVEELRQQLKRLRPERWVLKSRFGMSGRERLLGRNDELPDASQKWLASRLIRDSSVVFEPWVEKIAEAGMQWEVPCEGPPKFLGMTPLLSHAQGGYRGNRLEIDPTQFDTVWEPAIEATRHAAERIQQLGYFGPLGIDAMQYRDPSGKTLLRPLQDINARRTMGRLTLGWRRLLGTGECGSWLHVSRGRETKVSSGNKLETLLSSPPSGCRAWRTSPQTIAGQSCHHVSAFIAAESVPTRHAAERNYVQ